MLNIQFDDSELQAGLEHLVAEQLPSALEAAMTKAAMKVEADAKKNCPAETGTLRQSITHTVEAEGDTVKGYVGSNLEYAPYVHQGTGIYAKDGNGRKDVPWTFYDAKTGDFVSTKGIEPTPFLQDAVDTNRQQIIEFFKGLFSQ